MLFCGWRLGSGLGYIFLDPLFFVCGRERERVCVDRYISLAMWNAGIIIVVIVIIAYYSFVAVWKY